MRLLRQPWMSVLSRTMSVRLVLFIEHFAKAVEAEFPVRAVIPDPLLESRKTGRFDAAGSDAAGFFRADQFAVFENLEVLPDGGEGDAEGLSQSRDRRGPPAQQVEDGAASGIAERVKEAVDLCLRGLHLAIRSGGQFFSEAIDETAPPLLDHLRAVGPVDEGSLVGEHEIGAGS